MSGIVCEGVYVSSGNQNVFAGKRVISATFRINYRSAIMAVKNVFIPLCLSPPSAGTLNEIIHFIYQQAALVNRIAYIKLQKSVYLRYLTPLLASLPSPYQDKHSSLCFCSSYSNALLKSRSNNTQIKHLQAQMAKNCK